MNNFIRNGDFLEWPNGISLPVAAGATTTSVSGDLSFIKVGASQPSATISRQQHPVIASIKQGFPRYFMRVAPASAPVLGATDKAYLTYAFVETLDRAVAQGAYGYFSFWAKSSVDREIVVRFYRSFGSGGSNNNGSTSEVMVSKSVQILKGWKKYQVEGRFPAFAATYGIGSTVEARIYLQGGTTELGSEAISWTTATVDFSQVALTLTAISEDYSTIRIASGSSGADSTIYVTDSMFGAVGNYSGTQNTAGVGMDCQPAIQAALNYAYTQGAGGVNDTVNNISYTVKIPKGKYYLAAPADGSPTLVVPLKVSLDFSEAELHFDKPALVGGAPPFSWCAIKIGQLSNVTVGKMQMKAGLDLTYGGTWYGMTLDAIRVQETDGSSYICGGGREHYILGFRGAAIRPIASWNVWIENLDIASCMFGVVGSYYGTAFSSYARYRDGSDENNNVCTTCFIHGCSFLNIFKKAILFGVKGDAVAPGSGGMETFDGAHPGAKTGPIVVEHCAFEQIAEECLFSFGTTAVFVTNCEVETAGASGGSGVFSATSARAITLTNVQWVQQGNAMLIGSYTGPLASGIPQPLCFLFANVTNVAPALTNIFINNSQGSSCKLVDTAYSGGTIPIARKPVIINYRCESATQMQGTSVYMPVAPSNLGGEVWSMSTAGLGPDTGYAVDGSRVRFKFTPGFTVTKPAWVVADGARLTPTNSNGSTNWTWDGATFEVVMGSAPAKDIRAFF